MTHDQHHNKVEALQIALPEYDPVEEQLFRAQVQRIFEAVNTDISHVATFEDYNAQLSLKRYAFMSMAIGEH